ncbi:MAG: site-specific integrase [Planctomycetota bacterium]
MVELHNKRLSSITTPIVAKWHGAVGKEHGLVMANRCKKLLTTMFAKASAAVGYTGANPCKGVASNPEQSRERFLMPNEVEQFFNALANEPPYWQGFFLLLLFTGARRGNVQTMQWDELDLGNGVWHVPSGKAKSGKSIAIVLCEPALAILNTRYNERNGTPYVFPALRGSGCLKYPTVRWKRLVAIAGLPDLHQHDLRRTQGSWQASMGVSLAIVGKSLGHSDLKSTQVYARLQLDPVRAAVAGASQALLTAGKASVGTAGMVLDATSTEGGSNG